MNYNSSFVNIYAFVFLLSTGAAGQDDNQASAEDGIPTSVCVHGHYLELWHSGCHRLDCVQYLE